MKQTLTMTQAAPADLPAVWALCCQVVQKVPGCGWSAEYPTREYFKRDIEAGSLYLIKLAGALVSIMHICPWGEYAKGEEALNQGWNEEVKNPCALGRFCVAPSLQGQGLGRKCMQKSLEKAKQLGYDGVRFHAVVDNPIACHLYDSMGFHHAGLVHEFGKDFACYEKTL